MRNNLKAILLGAALWLPLAAQADDPYVKLGVGWTNYDYSGAPSANETGVSLAYGAMYDKMWGLEVGYVDFGRDRANDFKAESLYLAGTGTWPLNQQTALYGKLGVAVKRYKSTGVSDTHTTGMAGVGAKWMFNKEWGASLEYAYYGKSAGITIGQTTLAAIYNF